MKHIPKTAEPTAFTQWKIGEDPNWNPGWGELDSSRTMKTLVKKALLDEQGNICCYCGIGLTDTDSHIEHFRPRHGVYAFPQGEIEYANLLACCLPEKQDAAKNHCGMKKGAADPGQIVSPLDPTCEARFSYASNGEIEAHTKTDAIALNTISKLGFCRADCHGHAVVAAEPRQYIHAILFLNRLRTSKLCLIFACPLYKKPHIRCLLVHPGTVQVDQKQPLLVHITSVQVAPTWSLQH